MIPILDKETAEALRSALEKHVKKKYGTQAVAAAVWLVTPPFVCAVLGGRKSPPLWMLQDAGLALKIVQAEKP